MPAFLQAVRLRGARLFAGAALGAVLGLAVASSRAASPLVQLNATTYQTEHCLFIIDATVQWNSPSAAYNDLYASPFTRLSSYFTTLTTQFPASYFSVCYLANTGDLTHVPNYIDQIYKATGISTGTGSSGIGNGDPFAAQSFATVDFCRYNLAGYVSSTALAVYDHELGHAWGCQFFNNVSGVGPGILSNGHWLPNTTIDCQMSATYSPDGGITVNKLYGDPTHGFRYQRVDNLRSNDTQTFSEQTLYLMGLRETFPTTYALNSPVYLSDGTVTSGVVETYDHAAALARYGARNPDYRTAPKHFKLGFVYVARDVAEVNSVYQAVEQSIVQFCDGETIDPVHYRFQIPFLVDTHFRATVDGRLSDLDGVASPALAVTDTYVATTDGTATIHFTASDPAGPAPTVSVVPAAAQCSVVGSTVQAAGLPDGVHFFTLKAVNAGGKVAWGHFVVEVQRPVTSTAIATPPVTQTVVAGNVATFSVTASGTGGYSYQWFRRAANYSTWNPVSDGATFSGATGASLAVVSATNLNGDQFLCMVTNATGEATSQPATLVVNEVSPVLTSQPTDTTVNVGSVAHVSVAAGGAPQTFGYSYFQWQRQLAGSGTWTDVTDSAGAFVGATTASLAIYGAGVANSGDQYRCVVTNTAGATTSAAATLTVYQLPVITTHPANLMLNAGQTATFTVVATGSAPLTYQWQKYATPIPGATSATLTLTNVQASDIGSYGVVVTNPGGSTLSNFASLAVAATAPSITAQPQSITVSAGSPASFAVTVTGSTPLSYQWTRNGTNISGATSSTYSIANVQGSDAATYAVSVSNSAGTAISGSATLSVSPAIVTAPQSIAVVTGTAVTFSVTAAGAAPLTYQWRKNGTAISGATASTYSIASAQLSDAADYSVVVTNAAGNVTSGNATLTVTLAATAPTIATAPQGASLQVGGSLSLTIAANGTAPFTYQWYLNGAPLSGATGASYAVGSVQFSDAGSYTVTVTNTAGNVTSAPAVVTVSAVAPQISSPPQPVSAAAGGSATFSVTVTGTPPFTYQWYRNGGALAGATGSTLSLSALSVSDAGAYTVAVTNAGGTVTSSTAALTVATGVVLPTSLLANLSVRTNLASGQRLIPGFVTNGTKSLLLRVAGPTLTAFGIGLTGHPNPMVQVYNATSQLIDQNDDWSPSLAATFNQVGAFAFTDPHDAALLTTLSGVNSAIASGPGSGTVLLELYDTATDYSNRLVNVSARNFVGTGADVLIVGFVITGTGTKQLLIRGIGPTLGRFGVAGFLVDPYLQVYDATGHELTAADNWDPSLAATFAQVGAFALDPGSKDSALLVSLPPGVYSVKLSGVNNGTGEGLIEVYEIFP